ncbi:hypothetical protein DEA06_14335 [Microbacterium sp. Gd 4-13]|uniref:hypothetical protein n=1 Tax=Microbacterium sp. Gd 4-13 TaxID=2173179 RepID=UPI000D572067|nr:hypothetical protein [Microbacterium sp. Gd 4-13]PVW02951.1 hypothetical protein DEA06_14335 [Microbacterium sp. Gd 4-13]
MTPARPPALDELPTARPVRDGVRFAGWMVRGLWHGAWRRKSSPAARALSGVILVGACALIVPLGVAMPVLVARPRARYYMSPERDAVLAILATRTGWSVGDHATAEPGTGRGEALRAQLIPALLPFVDAAGIAVEATAATEDLAKRYAREIPGLLDTGKKDWPRGHKMRREPLNV